MEAFIDGFLSASRSLGIYAGYGSASSLRGRGKPHRLHSSLLWEEKLVLGDSSRQGGLPQPSWSPGLEGGCLQSGLRAACRGPGAQTQGYTKPVPSRAGHWHPYKDVILFLGGERFKGSVLENPRGRGIFSLMQITLSPQPSLTPVSSQPLAYPGYRWQPCPWDRYLEKRPHLLLVLGESRAGRIGGIGHPQQLPRTTHSSPI